MRRRRPIGCQFVPPLPRVLFHRGRVPPAGHEVRQQGRRRRGRSGRGGRLSVAHGGDVPRHVCLFARMDDR